MMIFVAMVCYEHYEAPTQTHDTTLTRRH